MDTKSTGRKRSLDGLPSIDSDAFDGVVGSLADCPPRNTKYPRYLHLPCPQAHESLRRAAPIAVKSDNTRCLIRALRSRTSTTSVQSAVVPGSLNSKLRQKQITQNLPISRQQDGAASSRDAFLADSVAGHERSESKLRMSSRSDSKATPSMSSKAGRQRLQSYAGMSREQRKACLRISLEAATSHSESEVLHTLKRNWAENPRCHQRITHQVRRDLAESAGRWSVLELRNYLRQAGLCATGCRMELVRRVFSHLRPPSDISASRPRSSTSAQDPCSTDHQGESAMG